MSDLHPCPACSRHYRASEDACPFCGDAAVPREAKNIPRGRFTRAAIFAGALVGAAALTACGPAQPKVADPPPPPPPAEVADAGAEPPPPPPPADARPPEKVREDLRGPDHQPRPYGAPPARQRLV